MVQAGFGGVPASALVSYGQEVTGGAWAAIDAKAYLPHKGGKPKALDEAPVLVFHKVMIHDAIEGLIAALAQTSGTVKALDDDWDEEQRTLDLELHLRARKRQPEAVRAAAARVRAVLLSAGTDQIGYDHDKEVEFGRQQVTTAGTPAVAGDIALLGIGDVLAAIGKATEALAKGIGYGTTVKTERGPARRVLAAQRAASGACSAAYESVTALLDRASDGKAPAANLVALKASLDGLLARREVPSAPGASPPPEAPPAPASGGNNPSAH